MEFTEHPVSKRRRREATGPLEGDDPVLVEKAVGAGLDALLDGSDDDEANYQRQVVLNKGDAHGRKIGPAEREKIATMYIQHVPIATIAKRIGVGSPAITKQIEKHIRPIWQEELKEDLAHDMQGVKLLEKIAWGRFRASMKPVDSLQETEEEVAADDRVEQSAIKRAKHLAKRVLNRKWQVGNTDWMKVIQWCFEFRAKIYGSYSPQKYEHNLKGGLRVAGMSPAELDESMMVRLAGKMAERRRYEAMMRGQGEN